MEEEKSQKSKKASIIALKAISAADEVGVLQHQNKELYSRVKLMKKRLLKHKRKSAALEKENRNNQSLQSIIIRNWNALDNDLSEVLNALGKSDKSQDLDPPKKKLKLSKEDSTNVSALISLLLTSGSEYLQGDIYSRKHDEDEEDEDEEEANVEVAFNAVDETMKGRVAFTQKLLNTLLENKEIADAPVTNVNHRAKCKEYKTISDTFKHRILLLEKNVKSLENQLEDATTEKEVAIRRLNGWKSLGGSQGNENETENETDSKAVVKTENTVKTEPNNNEEKEKTVSFDDGEKDEKLKVLEEELKSSEEMAAARLKELEDAKKLNISMTEELEKLRQNTSPIGEANGIVSDDKIKLSKLYVDIKSELEMVKKEREREKQNLERADHREAELKDRLRSYDKQLRNLENGIGKPFEDLKEREELQKKIKKLEIRNQGTEKSLKEAGGERKRVELKYKNMKQLDASRRESIEKLQNTVKELKADLEKSQKKKNELEDEIKKLLEGKFTDDDQKRLLENKDKEIEKHRAEVNNFADEMARMDNEMERANKKSLKHMTEMDAKIRKMEENSKYYISKKLKLEQELNEVKLDKDQIQKNLQKERDVRKSLQNDKIKPLQERLKSMDNLLEKVEASCENQRRVALEAEKNYAGIKFRFDSIEDERKKAEKKLLDLQKVNVQLSKEKMDLDFQVKRLKEHNSGVKRRFKRAKSQLESATSGSNAGAGSDLELRLDTFRTALRCPINTSLYKDTILMRCCHMHSSKAIWDCFKSRNRKCPTCKLPFTKDDIKDIFLIPNEKNV